MKSLLSMGKRVRSKNAETPVAVLAVRHKSLL
jgi:hypothetical protein